ncbi:MAG TPA: hypothetical protein VGD94_08905 [Vicinamibacterales bacterium]
MFVILAGSGAAQTSDQDTRHSRVWVAAGGGSTTVLGDCTDCAPGTHLHTGHTVVGGGFTLSERADIGGEVVWVPLHLATGDSVRSTLVTAAVQVRPWRTRGFFLKGSSGMAFLRNFVDVVEDVPAMSTSKAFTMGLGAGWEWRTAGRFGFEVFGTHHVVAVGDLAGRERRLENVVGNFWSVGGAVVIR